VGLLQKRGGGGTLHHNRIPFNPVIKACGQFVVFLYEVNIYPAIIISFNDENVYISAMVKSLKSWRGQRSQVFLNVNGVTR
jgi:hypothetical protein